jgi:hypothetical protein
MLAALAQTENRCLSDTDPTQFPGRGGCVFGNTAKVAIVTLSNLCPTFGSRLTSMDRVSA